MQNSNRTSSGSTLTEYDIISRVYLTFSNDLWDFSTNLPTSVYQKRIKVYKQPAKYLEPVSIREEMKRFLTHKKENNTAETEKIDQMLNGDINLDDEAIEIFISIMKDHFQYNPLKLSDEDTITQKHIKDFANKKASFEQPSGWVPEMIVFFL